MPYSMEEVVLSQEIFYFLLEHHELSELNNKDLYKNYIDSDAVQTLVHSQAEVAKVDIARYSNVVYLIPLEDNYFLGFSRSELRQQLCRSNNAEDYYLVIFVILVLILKFYNGYGISCKIREHINFGELQNEISAYLKKGSNRIPDEKDQNDSGLLFTAMSQAYESLRSEDKVTRKKTTKEGFLYRIIRFLQDQGLIIYIDTDEMIKTTQKFDHFMDWNLLDKNNFDRVRKIFDNSQN